MKIGHKIASLKKIQTDSKFMQESQLDNTNGLGCTRSKNISSNIAIKVHISFSLAENIFEFESTFTGL